MGHQIIKQPNGLYCLFSSIVDDFVLIDATPDDIVNEWVIKYRQDMIEKVRDIVSALDKQEKPYYQFTMSFEDAVNIVREVHGKKANSLRLLGVK